MIINLFPKVLKLEIRTYLESVFCLVQFSRSVVSDSLQPHEAQHARPPSLSPELTQTHVH